MVDRGVGDWGSFPEVRSVAQVDWQAPAMLPAQLNAPHARQSARFTVCSASRRPAGSLRQAVLLNAATAALSESPNVIGICAPAAPPIMLRIGTHSLNPIPNPNTIP